MSIPGYRLPTAATVRLFQYGCPTGGNPTRSRSWGVARSMNRFISGRPPQFWKVSCPQLTVSDRLKPMFCASVLSSAAVIREPRWNVLIEYTRTCPAGTTTGISCSYNSGTLGGCDGGALVGHPGSTPEAQHM